MKMFDAELFKQTLMQTPWDSVYIFDEIDDMLDSWEKLFIDALEQHCPWRTKRVARVNHASSLDNTCDYKTTTVKGCLTKKV